MGVVGSTEVATEAPDQGPFRKRDLGFRPCFCAVMQIRPIGLSVSVSLRLQEEGVSVSSPSISKALTSPGELLMALSWPSAPHSRTQISFPAPGLAWARHTRPSSGVSGHPADRAL